MIYCTHLVWWFVGGARVTWWLVSFVIHKTLRQTYFIFILYFIFSVIYIIYIYISNDVFLICLFCLIQSIDDTKCIAKTYYIENSNTIYFLAICVYLFTHTQIFTHVIAVGYVVRRPFYFEYIQIYLLFKKNIWFIYLGLKCAEFIHMICLEIAGR